MSNKLFIQTLGCQMNVRDSEHIIAELKNKKNYTVTQNLKEADLIIINTCSVREKPVSKLFSELGLYKKQKKSSAKLGVCGCTASHLGDEIIKKAPYVDFVLGARNVSKITSIIDKKGSVEVDLAYDESSYVFNDFRTSPFRAYINISIGCDKSCAYCIVPNTRGEEVSIPQELILNETKKAAQSGAKEIYLLGQNVNNYGKYFSDNREKSTFVELLRSISKIDQVKRIRFASPHPLHMDDEFIEEFAANDKICKAIHMPLQSGSTKTLKEMKRGYTKEWFLDRVKKLKKLIPDVAISTDIIVGFPNESDEDFLETIDVIKKVEFSQIFSFKFSPRPYTSAKDFKNQISSDVSSSRLEEVIKTQNNILDTLSKKELNKIHKVYFEELKPNGYISGKSDNNWVVKVKGSEDLLGKISDVKITQTNRMSLEGELI